MKAALTLTLTLTLILTLTLTLYNSSACCFEQLPTH